MNLVESEHAFRKFWTIFLDSHTLFRFEDDLFQPIPCYFAFDPTEASIVGFQEAQLVLRVNRIPKCTVSAT